MKNKEVPKGIRKIILATLVRWIGWGFGETFIPIFLLLFSTSLLETGLLASVYNIFFFISIPLAGFLADRIRSKKIILFGLILYIFIGLGYFLAGVTSAIIFVVITRALNGISYSFDQVGRETYIMKHSPRGKVATILGHEEWIPSLGWIIAVLIGFALVKFVPIHWLLFLVVPTTIVSIFIILSLKEKSMPLKKVHFSFKEVYVNFFKRVLTFTPGLKLVVIVAVLFGILESVFYFFVPVSNYLNGESLLSSVSLILAYSVPYLFSGFLGKIIDKKHERIYPIGIIAVIGLLLCLIFFDNYFVTLGVMFFASLIFELVFLANSSLVARLADRTHLGEIDGSMNAFSSLGAIIGPILFGLIIDLSGITVAYSVVIGLTFLVLIAFFFFRRHFHTKRSVK